MNFLHIGLNKSGSSSIQAFCDRHRQILREHGLDYPKVGIHDAAHYGVSKRLIGRPDAAQVPDADGLEKAVREAVGAGRHVLLSSEYFFLANDAEVARIHELLTSLGAECRIVIYLRRHDQWIASLFNQALKTVPRYSPWQSDIRDYTLHLLGNREIELRYPVILDRWAKCFGVKAMIVRPFEAAQFLHGDFVWDFLAQIDAGLPAVLKAKGLMPQRVNESVPEHVLRAVDAVRSSGIDPEAAKVAIAHMVRSRGAQQAVKHVRRPWDGRMFELTPPLRKSILRMFADDYSYVVQRYLREATDGVLFKGPAT
jgi:hypothetical protein